MKKTLLVKAIKNGTVIDHIIATKNNFFSFKEKGII